jgi:hypothetical protein
MTTTKDRFCRQDLIDLVSLETRHPFKSHLGVKAHSWCSVTLTVMTTVQSLAHAERAEFADLLDGLTLQQWGAPSLCDGWSVQNVVAHTVAYLQ